MSFINSFFLFAMGAAALPIIYHLIRKIKAKTVPFSSLMFIKATPKELIRRRRLRDLILLLVRSAILALLAFAFARPFIPRERIPFISQEVDKSIVILFDVSYSMQYEDLFDRAVEEIKNRLDNGGINDEFSIVSFSDQPTQHTNLSGDIAIHKNIIESTIKVSNRPTDFYKPIKLAEEILKDAKNPERQIVLVSDFQDNAWSSQFENWKLEKGVTFIPVEINTTEVANNYVEAFSFTQSRNGDKVAGEYDVRVASINPGDLEGSEVSLVINGKEVDKNSVMRTQGDRVYFQQENIRPGSYQGEIKIDTDKLQVDDTFYFTYAVKPKPALLGINNRNDDVFFIKNAFDLGEFSLYTFTAGGRTRFSSANLRNQKLVFLNNVATLTAQQLTNLKNYAEAGGTLFISFGDRANLSQYSNYLTALGLGTIDKKIVVRTLQRNDAIIGEVDLKHPVFSVFAKHGTADLFKPKFREYVKVIPDSNAIVVSKYDTGDPFFIESKIGNGKALLFTSSFSLDAGWTNLPQREIFLPFLYQVAEYAVASEELRKSFRAGEVVEFKGKADEEWEVSAPGNNIYKVTLDAQGKEFFRETEVPGNYMATNGTVRYDFSVNIDVVESELATRDADEVYASVTVPSNEIQEEVDAVLAQEIAIEEKRQKFWRYVIILLLMLFVFETYFANKKIKVKL